MSELAAWRAQQPDVWGAGAWQDAGEALLAPAHDELMRRLAPATGERWLDVACGTGAVARRAARAGAVVVGVDLAPRLIETARRLAAAQHLTISFDVGDTERLPYADDTFDVVCSAHGVAFAADHRAAAGELARVCSPGGRLGVTFWQSHPELERLMDRVGLPRPSDADRPRDWGRREYVTTLLGAAFDLEFSDQMCAWRAASGEDAWGQFVASNGRAKLGVAAMPEAAREQLHTDWVRFFDAHAQRDGGISVARPYLLIVGHRR
jgi:SAM-dependent methyltransferase